MPSDAKTLNVEEGNAIFYCVKEVPTTFKQICQKIHDISIVGKSDLLFSTTMYKENSIKSLEKTSNGSGQKRVIKGESTKRPQNLKSFFQRCRAVIISGENFKTKKFYPSVKRTPTYLKTRSITDDDRDSQVGV